MFTNFVNMASKSKVYFFFDKVRPSLNDRAKLKKDIEKIFSKEGKRLHHINYVFCSDKKLLAINREYLSHDFYTDIITFDLSESGQGVAGEVFISTDRVKENANELKIPFSQEIRRVMYHGALHLCGYGDKTRKEEKEMREKEDHYLRVFGST